MGVRKGGYNCLEQPFRRTTRTLPIKETKQIPELTQDEIKSRIADGTISAISIDTAVFDKYKCNLGFAVLAHWISSKRAG